MPYMIDPMKFTVREGDPPARTGGAHREPNPLLELVVNANADRKWRYFEAVSIKPSVEVTNPVTNKTGKNTELYELSRMLRNAGKFLKVSIVTSKQHSKKKDTVDYYWKVVDKISYANRTKAE